MNDEQRIAVLAVITEVTADNLRSALQMSKNESRAWFPAPSVAEQVTCVMPSGNVPPDAGTQLATPSPLTASCVAGEV